MSCLVRRLFVIVAILVVAGCGGGARRSVQLPAPEPVVVDSGTLVRVRLQWGNVIGPLLAPFSPESLTLVVCEAGTETPCASMSAPGAIRIPISDVRSVAVRGKKSFDYALRGIYIGALAGAAVLPADEDGTTFLLGGLVGAGLGKVIGGRVTGWIPLFPCGPHGECRWRGVTLAGAVPGK